MKNIIKLSTIAMFALMANSSQATQLVEAQSINAIELMATTKLHLEESIKLNTIAFNPIEKTARAQVAMNEVKINLNGQTISKSIPLAE
ncbi:hypothetical protein H4J50_08250 [Colwellia sp. 6M3]|jgi:hypothetical protein|uniref:hypothetical protein n=1 Tax=Colwellia sp. 6M3 TaxID=2759849 RepID=UPI0015F6E076|nr:hypothetical protein [Colwellia sp. 6M3]MBA6416001.1 hypothetical protein [Colwellia sp. 6M3]|tara:strand:- start:390 stop:656 length:267 start_codon:yes stop_codon:yes gene_type:complete